MLRVLISNVKVRTSQVVSNLKRSSSVIARAYEQIPIEYDKAVFPTDQTSWIPAYAGMTGGGGAVPGTGNHKGNCSN